MKEIEMLLSQRNKLNEMLMYSTDENEIVELEQKIKYINYNIEKKELYGSN